jgi:hypothetical protein
VSRSSDAGVALAEFVIGRKIKATGRAGKDGPS